MALELVTMSTREFDRLDVIRRIFEKQVTQAKAGDILGLSAASASSSLINLGTAETALASSSRSMAVTTSGSKIVARAARSPAADAAARAT